MKLFTSILALFLICGTLNAQSKKIKGNGSVTTDNRTVKSFDKVSVAGSFDIELVKGKEGVIAVKAASNLMEYIITEVKNDKLSIRTKKGYRISTSKSITITVNYNQLNAVSLAGSGDITAKDMIKAEDLKVSVAGSGDLNLAVDATNLKASVAGSGDIRLNGNSSNFKCSVAGSGDIMAYDLKANVVNANVAGSGDIQVNATNEIHAKVAGSGDISYTGNPTIEKTASTGSGSIRKK